MSDQQTFVRVAKVGQRVPGPELLPPSAWRDKLRSLAYWLLVALIGVTVWPTLVYLAFRA